MPIPSNLLRTNASEIENKIESLTEQLTNINPLAQVDRIKVQRQKASVKTLKFELNKAEKPFTQREELRVKEQKNSVLGRFNRG